MYIPEDGFNYGEMWMYNITVQSNWTLLTTMVDSSVNCTMLGNGSKICDLIPAWPNNVYVLFQYCTNINTFCSGHLGILWCLRPGRIMQINFGCLVVQMEQVNKNTLTKPKVKYLLLSFCSGIQ
jgi:hypothetical protein